MSSTSSQALVQVQACGAIGFDEVEEAFAKMYRGEVLRSVVVL